MISLLKPRCDFLIDLAFSGEIDILKEALLYSTLKIDYAGNISQQSLLDASSL